MDKKTKMLYKIQTQIERIQRIERELKSEGYEIKKSYTNKVKMPSPNAPLSVMERKLSELKQINKTTLKENAKSFTWTHEVFDPETGEIIKGETRTITKNIVKRGTYIVKKQRGIDKKQHQWVGSVPQSLFDLADTKFREFYQANVVASGNDKSAYIPGGHYGYRDSATMPKVDYVVQLWESFKNKYRGTEGQKIWFDSVKQKVSDTISAIMNIDSTFGSAQQFVINDTAEQIARILSDKGIPARYSDDGDISPIGTPWEPEQYDIQADMEE